MEPIPDIERSILQRNLAAIRAIFGWRQEDLLKILGVSRGTMSKIESFNYDLTNIEYYALMWVIQTEMDHLSDIGEEREEKKIGLVTKMLRYNIKHIYPEYSIDFEDDSRN